MADGRRLLGVNQGGLRQGSCFDWSRVEIGKLIAATEAVFNTTVHTGCILMVSGFLQVSPVICSRRM